MAVPLLWRVARAAVRRLLALRQRCHRLNGAAAVPAKRVDRGPGSEEFDVVAIAGLSLAIVDLRQDEVLQVRQFLVIQRRDVQRLKGALQRRTAASPAVCSAAGG
jgi:hypothetical protein